MKEKRQLEFNSFNIWMMTTILGHVSDALVCWVMLLEGDSSVTEDSKKRIANAYRKLSSVSAELDYARTKLVKKEGKK